MGCILVFFYLKDTEPLALGEPREGVSLGSWHTRFYLGYLLKLFGAESFGTNANVGELHRGRIIGAVVQQLSPVNDGKIHSSTPSI